MFKQKNDYVNKNTTASKQTDANHKYLNVDVSTVTIFLFKILGSFVKLHKI